ncbi:VPS10 domain-containing protein [Sphingomonas nostoxanthinifaciens]|uniref:VPS10 domain-containing protein n=1 Tax=Sphingomonas nostoxanthinifaciens TaxID=2872652 RepID=UPI001CC20699|nr:hypothetical protein [Sphingomonas nostoxanthinifaciens]UAK23134.1 hypothetical protein K8P63_11980 [Sphingomonas nostoxanthinifaciens]
MVRMLVRFCGYVLTLVSLALAGACASRADVPDNPSNPLAQLHYRMIGPGGNRMAAVAGEPGNPLVIYAGASDGGIRKTTDGGSNWKPVFDDKDVSAVGALAVAPSAHNVVWAGTGETWIVRPDYSMGNGVYKSTDGGETWTHMGLDLTGHVGRILIDPKNPDIVYACAMGQAYRPQQERGIYKTTDGGKTWTRSLFVNENTGCSELSMDPKDPNTMFAGMWQVDIKTWDLHSGGKGSGVYVTHDAGKSWTKVAGNGLPAADKVIGKVAVQVAPTDPNRVYALIQEDTPRFYRSDDAGKSWRIVNQQHIMSERSSYYTRFAVAPDDENFIFVVAVSIVYSRDAGVTFAEDLPHPAGDVHDVWYDPLNPNRVMVAHDHGISVSLNHVKSFQTYGFPVAQMYHAFTDDQIPYNVYGNRQDEPTFRGPSDNLSGGKGDGIFGGGISAADWTQIGGCEPGFSIPDWKDNNIVWSGCYNGDLTRMDLRTGQARWVSPWPAATYGWAPKDVKYRFHWTMPIAMSPHDNNKIYVGSQYVHMTENGGQSWKAISPDLTRNDKSRQLDSGGMHPDNLMVFEGSVLYAIAESPVQPGVIWTGATDGTVSVTRDGGKSWDNVTRNIKGMPPLGIIWSITPSRFDAGTAYVVNNMEQSAGDYNAYAYKTSDFGKTWKLITSGVPKSVNSSAHILLEDPTRKGLLYLGTDNFIYVSWDDGGKWTLLRNNMPPAPIYWMTIQPRYNDLVVATYGRGFWILDDLKPIQEFDKAEANGTAVTFFRPRDTYRYRTNNATHLADTYNLMVGENPPHGAPLNYYLKAPAQKVTVSISDGNGRLVRTLGGPARAGVNRLWWDLRYEAPVTVKLLNSPPGEPWVPLDKQGWRPLVHWRNYTHGPLVAPGAYSVKIDVDGQISTQPLTVLRDPKDLGSETDIKANTDFLLGLVDDLNGAAATINRLEEVRKQIGDLHAQHGKEPAYAARIAAADRMDARLKEVEALYFPLALTGRIEDAFRVPSLIYGNLANLAFLTEGGADLPPTDQAVALHGELRQQLAHAKQQADLLEQQEVGPFLAGLAR